MTDTETMYTLCEAETQEQKEAIYRFRFDIFGREMGLLGPLDQWESPRFYDPLDDQSQHFFAERAGEIVGAIRITHGLSCTTSEEFLETYELQPFLDILPPKKIAVVTRLMVSSELRGSLLSFHLMEHTARFCVEQRVECVFADCQPHLVPLYQRYGFRPYRTVFNDRFVGIMVPLVCIADFEHLKQVGSPLLPLFEHALTPDKKIIDKLRHQVSSVPSVVSAALDGEQSYFKTIYKHLKKTDAPDADLGFWQGFSEQDIRELVASNYLVRCKKGDVVIHRTHATRTMFLVLKGTLECERDNQIVGFASEGDILGEFAFFVNSPRSANVRVVSDEAELIAVGKNQMNHLMEEYPRLAARYLFNLSKLLCVKFLNNLGLPFDVR